MRKYAFHLFVFLTVFILNTIDANAVNRTALVIGNGDYYLSTQLRNPVNDANDIAAVLNAKGFDVTLKTNVNLKTMASAIRKFGKSLRKGDVGLFYYAGHGLQVKGRNYLIPVESSIESKIDIEYEAVDVSQILHIMEIAGNQLNIVILDACRNNPFASGFKSSAPGLARMDAPRGSLVAYATSPGSVTIDGTDRNSIFTKHLLNNLKKPQLRIEEVFKNIRIAVGKETDNRQIPWESSSLTGDFYFFKKAPEHESLQKASAQKASAQNDSPPEPSPPKALARKASALEGVFSTSSITSFSWPPPRPSSSTAISRHLLFDKKSETLLTLGQLSERIRTALDQSGYFDIAFYGIPDPMHFGGFAMVTRMEQIDQRGVPVEGDKRWISMNKKSINFSLTEYLNALFFAEPGFYRIIVFTVTPQPLTSFDDEQVSAQKAEMWIKEGSPSLPTSISSQQYKVLHQVNALVYEFSKQQTKSSLPQKDYLVLPGNHQAKTHLMRSGIWNSLVGED